MASPSRCRGPPPYQINQNDSGSLGGRTHCAKQKALSAEEEGFEPTVPRRGTPVFETGPFNHSGTPPGLARLCDGHSRVVGRRLRKKRVRISPQALAMIPGVTAARWFRRGSV